MKKLLIILVIVLSPLSAGAQTLSSCAVSPVPVSINLESELVSSVASASIGIYANMANAGADQLTNAALAVDVVRNADGAIVDRFVVPQRLTLFASSTARIGFIWKIPAGLSAGKYTVITTFAPQDAPRAQVFAHTQYPTARLPITVTGDEIDGVIVKKVSVNGQTYRPWAVASLASGSASIQAVVANETRVPYDGTLTWRIYPPSASLDAKPQSATLSTLELFPAGMGTASYMIPSQNQGAYYIEGQLTGASAPQYVDILVARDAASFPWSGCVPATRAGLGQPSARFYLYLTGGFVLLALAYEVLRLRRRA